MLKHAYEVRAFAVPVCGHEPIHEGSKHQFSFRPSTRSPVYEILDYQPKQSVLALVPLYLVVPCSIRLLTYKLMSLTQEEDQETTR